MLALLVDWGYRPDGIPVRLFGAWTTLPAGPATLAAKTGSWILPIAIRRTPADRLQRVVRAEPITVAVQRPGRPPAGDPGRSPTRWRRPIGAAPDQWYSFKPMWPPTEAEAADLEARAAAMLADDGPRRIAGARPVDRPSPTAEPRRSRNRAGRRACRRRTAPRDRRISGGVTAVRGRVAPRRPWPAPAGALLSPPRGSPAICPRARSIALAELAGAAWYRLAPGARRPGPSQPAPRRPPPRATRPRPTPGRGPPPPTRAPSSASSGRPSATAPATTSRSLRAPALDLATSTDRLVVETPERASRPRSPRRADRLRRRSTSAPIELPGALPRRPRPARRVVAPMETVGDPALQAWFDADPRPRSASGSSACARLAASCSAALRARRASSGLVGRPRPHRRRRRGPALRGAGADLPLGPALLAIESRRADLRRRRPADRAGCTYRGRLDAVPVPAEGTPPRAGRRRPIAAEAAAFERLIAERPGAVVGGLRPDLARPRGRGRGARPRRPSGRDDGRRGRGGGVTGRLGRADLHIHTLASDGTAGIVEILEHVERGDRPRRHRDHRPRADRRRAGRPGDRRATAGCGSRSSSARRSRRSAATCWPCSSRSRIRPFRSLRSTIAAIHDAGRARDPGPPARAVPAVRPGLGPPPAARRPRPARSARTRIETFNPTTLGRPWHARVVRFADEHGLADRRQQRRPRRWRRSGPAGRRSRAGRAADLRAAIVERRTPPPRRRSTATAVAARDVRAAAPQVRPRRARRPAPGGSAATARAATSATRAAATGRPASSEALAEERAAGPRGPTRDEDRPRLARTSTRCPAASPSTSATSTRTSACAATTSGS